VTFYVCRMSDNVDR